MFILQSLVQIQSYSNKIIMEAGCCSDNIFQSFWVLQHPFHNTPISCKWNAYYRNNFLNAWIVAFNCTEYSLRTLSSLNIFLQHALSSDRTFKFCVINQHIPLNNDSILALLQNLFYNNYGIPHGGSFSDIYDESTDKQAKFILLI